MYMYIVMYAHLSALLASIKEPSTVDKGFLSLSAE